MQLRNFICLAAVILCGWLAITFMTDVPTKRYPKLDKHVRADHPASPEKKPHLMVADGESHEIIHFSVSH